MEDKQVDTKLVVKAVRDAIGGIADIFDPYLAHSDIWGGGLGGVVMGKLMPVMGRL